MRFDEQGMLRTLIPPGSIRFILSIVCSIISLVSALALVILVFGRQLNSDLLAKLIVVIFIIGVFGIVHPNFRLTRGEKWPLTYMSVLLLSCILITSITLIWSYFDGLEDVYAGGALGLVFGVLGLWGYRSKALEKLRSHFDQVWQDEYQKREHLRKGR